MLTALRKEVCATSPATTRRTRRADDTSLSNGTISDKTGPNLNGAAAHTLTGGMAAARNGVTPGKIHGRAAAPATRLMAMNDRGLNLGTLLWTFALVPPSRWS